MRQKLPERDSATRENRDRKQFYLRLPAYDNSPWGAQDGGGGEENHGYSCMMPSTA